MYSHMNWQADCAPGIVPVAVLPAGLVASIWCRAIQPR
jgi:hypothetical protein